MRWGDGVDLVGATRLEIDDVSLFTFYLQGLLTAYFSSLDTRKRIILFRKVRDLTGKGLPRQ